MAEIAKEKMVVIINGEGGAGKDTLIRMISDEYKIFNVSSVDRVKVAAEMLGWNGDKGCRDREFLAKIKQLSIAYNDGPFQYVMEQYKRFLKDPERILFIHIREPEEIERVKAAITQCRVVSLLIKKGFGEKTKWGNEADDNVMNYEYDYVYENSHPLEEAKRDFAEFINRMLENEIDDEVKIRELIYKLSLDCNSLNAIAGAIRPMMPKNAGVINTIQKRIWTVIDMLEDMLDANENK